MLYADKENLKTHVAQELLMVREKEMRFYAQNLSTVGTHAALLAGFAFTILSQYSFETPDQGFLSYEMEQWLGMWPEGHTIPLSAETVAVRKGCGTWPWNVWINQLCQLCHLTFTTVGMTLQLWTVYTCVTTNILGLHLALRGPEGSVDRAVRHMAQQNQFALKKFTTGLGLFMLSVIFLTFAEYQFYVSFIINLSVMFMSWQAFSHIRELVSTFYVPKNVTVTGQWELDKAKRKNEKESAGYRGAKAASNNEPAPNCGVLSMGEMLAGRYNSSSFSNGRAPCGNRLKHYLNHVAARVKRGGAGVRGSKWGYRFSQMSMMKDEEVGSNKEVQAPSCVADHLISMQQALPIERQDSGGLARAPSLRRTGTGRMRQFLVRGGSWSRSSCCGRSMRNSSVNINSSRASARRDLNGPRELSRGSYNDDPNYGSIDSEEGFRSPCGNPRGGPSAAGACSSGADRCAPAAAPERSSHFASALGLPTFMDEIIVGLGQKSGADAASHVQSAVRGGIERQRQRYAAEVSRRESMAAGGYGRQSSASVTSVCSALEDRGAGVNGPACGRAQMEIGVEGLGGESGLGGQVSELVGSVLDKLNIPCDPRAEAAARREAAAAGATPSPRQGTGGHGGRRLSQEAIDAAVRWSGVDYGRDGSPSSSPPLNSTPGSSFGGGGSHSFGVPTRSPAQSRASRVSSNRVSRTVNWGVARQSPAGTPVGSAYGSASVSGRRSCLSSDNLGDARQAAVLSAPGHTCARRSSMGESVCSQVSLMSTRITEGEDSARESGAWGAPAASPRPTPLCPSGSADLRRVACRDT